MATSSTESSASDASSTGSHTPSTRASLSSRASHSICSTCGPSDSPPEESSSSDSDVSIRTANSSLDWLTDDIDANELQNVLKHCRVRSASGPDGISYMLLKHLPECIITALAKLYNTCLITGYFPRRWKEANGIMLAKPGKDHTLATSYRPISLLCTTGKLFERIIARRLTDHFDEIGFFNEWQRAYLRGKEANEIVYRLAEEIDLSRQAGWSTTAISLDVEKAFDSVWHEGLRYKLLHTGLPIGICRSFR